MNVFYILGAGPGSKGSLGDPGDPDRLDHEVIRVIQL